MQTGPVAACTPICVALMLGVLLLPALVPAQNAVIGKDLPRPHVDLILVIDTSESMIGAGGAPVIFPAVREAAKQLVDWCEPGDSVALISYDEKVRKPELTRIGGAADKGPVKHRLDTLNAKGLWTYTAAAVRDGLEEAQRLDKAEESLPEGPHVKMIVLMTDGINDPPPYVKKGGAVALTEVAKRYTDMPWFVWQVQVGPEIDREVDDARLPGYQLIQQQEAAKLMTTVREQIIKKVEEKTRRWGLRLEPAALDFAALQQGQRGTKEIHLTTQSSEGTGHVRLRASTANTGVRTAVVPEELPIQAGQGLAQVSIELAPDAPLGPVTGLITAEVTEGPLELKTPGLTWTANVSARPHTLRIEPASLDFANPHPGARVTKDLTVVAEPGVSGGQIRLQPESMPLDLTVTIEPAEVGINAEGKGSTKVTLTVGPAAAAGARKGQLRVIVVGGALELKTPTIDWSATVEWSPVRLEPETLDFGRVKPRGRETRELRLSSTAGNVTGKVRLRPEGVSPGVQVTVVPEEVTIQTAGEGRAQVSVEILQGTAAGKVQGQIVGDVTQGPLDLKPHAIAWSVTIAHSPLRLAGIIGAIVVVLTGTGAALWWIRRPRLRGTLRYWKDGGAEQSLDLAPYGTGQVRIDGPSSEVPLEGVEGKGATIRATRQDGMVLCTVQADPGSLLQFEGNALSRLDLYDQDTFSFSGYSFEYRGEVPARPQRT